MSPKLSGNLRPMTSSVLKSFGLTCLCLLAALHAGCFWQRCRLNKSDLPALLGFRLGTNREELQTRFPGLKVKDADYTELFISGSKTLPKDQDVSSVDEIGHVTVSTLRFPEFAEIDTVELKLEDGRVSAIELTYQDASKWKNEDEFRKFVARTLHLPDPQRWTTNPRNSYRREGASVTCNGLTVGAGFHVIIGTPRAPGGLAAMAFPFITIEDDNSRLKNRQ